MSSTARSILRKSVYFSCFGATTDELIKAGRFFEVDAHERITSYGEPIKEIFVPVNGTVSLALPTGRAGDETRAGEVAPCCPIGLKDFMNDRGYSFAAITDTPTIMFAVPKEAWRSLMLSSEGRLNRSLLLASSAAVRGFVEELIQNKVTGKTIPELLARIPLKTQRFDRGAVLSFSEPSLIFVQEGQIKITHYSGGLTRDMVVDEGEWTGGYYFKEAADDLDLKFTAVRPTQVHSLALSEILKVAPLSTFTGLYASDFIVRENETKILAFKDKERFKAPNPEDLRKLGYEVDTSKMIFNVDPSRWAAATVMNICALLHADCHFSSLEGDLDAFGRVSLGRLAEVLERQGLLTRALRCRTKGLRRQVLPLILPLGGRPCILLKISGDDYTVLDPVAGLRLYSVNELRAKWKGGQALEVTKSVIEYAMEDANLRKYSHDAARVAEHVLEIIFSGDKPTYRNLFILGLCAAMLEAALPRFFEYVVDVDLLQRNFHATPTLVAGFLLVSVALVVSKAAKRVVSAYKLGDLTFETRTLLMRQLMQLPSEFAGDNKTGSSASMLELIDHITHAGHKVREELRVSIFTMVLFFLIVLKYSWQVGLLVAVSGGALSFIKYLYMTKKMHELPGTTPLRGEAKVAFTEQIENIAQIKATNSEHASVKKTGERYVSVVAVYDRITRIVTNGWGAVGVGRSFIKTAAFGLLIWAAVSGTLTPGGFVAASLYLTLFWKTLDEVNAQIGEYQFFALESRGYRRYTRGNLEYSLGYSQSVHAHKLKGKIVFDRVSFKHETASNLTLNDVSFSVQPGEVLAVVGQSGAGKTSLVRLLAGLAKPSSGNILYDDINGRGISTFSLFDQIGYVEQRPTLMTGTIAANIAYGDDSPDFERVVAAAKQSSANRFIEKLPNGYQHFLHNSGLELSAGQRMQIAIARMFYKRPAILVIDEVDVNLDPFSMRILTENLQAFMKQGTVIRVTQRLSTLQSVDRILVLKNGIVVESGNHDQLMKNNREYVELFRTQVSSY